MCPLAKPSLMRPTSDAANVRQQVARLIQRSIELRIGLTELPAIAHHSRTTKVRSARAVLLGLLALAVVIFIPWFCMDYDDCYVNFPAAWTNAFRAPPASCQFCHNHGGTTGDNEVRRIANVRPDDFERDFAYSSVPVVVTDATANWTALEVFDFWYFKDIYEKARKNQRKTDCQFFPYKSGLTSLDEALNIPAERVNYAKGTEPWYFGWSNCNPDVAQQLRQHYGRPYFLPATSENDDTDWMFMGGPGLGAHMHVDNVRLPSWQAQIRGAKEWTLAPPPECYFECSSVTAIVNTGDIIVLNTNQWYHKTRVLPGELSITIGAEYD